MTAPTYTRADFQTEQEVRWCPGCGDYTILASTQQLLAGLGRNREEFVFISGIGCSSRFPYYMNTMGCTRSTASPSHRYRCSNRPARPVGMGGNWRR